MDALKRAEKARQAEASSDGAELDLASTQGFSLDPIDEPPSAERSAPREPTLDQPVSPSDPRFDSSSGLSLENTQSVHGRLGIEEGAAGGFLIPLDLKEAVQEWLASYDRYMDRAGTRQAEKYCLHCHQFIYRTPLAPFCCGSCKAAYERARDAL